LNGLMMASIFFIRPLRAGAWNRVANATASLLRYDLEGAYHSQVSPLFHLPVTQGLRRDA